MANSWIDLIPRLLYQHAQAAVARAGRADVVREAAALTAYASGRYEGGPARCAPLVVCVAIVAAAVEAMPAWLRPSEKMSRYQFDSPPIPLDPDLAEQVEPCSSPLALARISVRPRSAS